MKRINKEYALLGSHALETKKKSHAIFFGAHALRRVAVVVVGLAAVLDSVLEDDVGLTFVALSSRAFFMFC